MSNYFVNVSVKLLKRAVAVREKIESLEAELVDIFGTSSPSENGAPKKKGRKGMSAAARAKISAAQKARWAKHKSAVPSIAKAGRRKMSAAGRAKIAAAARARWAAVRAAKKA